MVNALALSSKRVALFSALFSIRGYFWLCFALNAIRNIQNIWKSLRKCEKYKKNADSKKVSQTKANQKECVLRSRSPVFANGSDLALFFEKLSGALVALARKRASL